MPEMHFNVKWPDGSEDRCYSPSWVIEEHLQVGSDYPVAEFVARAATALDIASERVRAKYGFACSSALDQLSALRTKAEQLSPSEQRGSVRVLSFEKHAPRDAKAKDAS
jgi:uncharacterized repeat protein (TIGR04042 family)